MRITWAEMMATLWEYGEKWDFLQIKTVGRSFRGREIPVVSIGQGRKNYLYVGAHHGAEGITSGVLLKFIEEISTLIHSGKKICGMDGEYFLKTRRIGVIPMLNPDGVEISVKGVGADDVMAERLRRMNGSGDFTLWQANGRGVDLNHNYNDSFGEYKREEQKKGLFSGAAGKYSGEYPESEPECSAICQYIRRERPEWIISLHTQGEEIYYSSRGFAPGGGKRNALIAKKLTGYEIREPVGSASMGGLLDWVIRECGIPCLTLECGKGVNPLPETMTRSIYADLRELLVSAPMLFSGK